MSSAPRTVLELVDRLARKNDLWRRSLDTIGDISPGKVTVTNLVEAKNEDDYPFAGPTPCRLGGQDGFAVRLLPYHDDLSNPTNLGCHCGPVPASPPRSGAA